MNSVRESLAFYRMIDVLLMATGSTLLYAFRANLKAKAVALGLIVQSSVMFLVHVLAFYVDMAWIFS